MERETLQTSSNLESTLDLAGGVVAVVVSSEAMEVTVVVVVVIGLRWVLLPVMTRLVLEQLATECSLTMFPLVFLQCRLQERTRQFRHPS